VKGLALLHKDFRQAMLSANRAHEKPVISEETLKQILGNIGSLLALNAGMLQELEDRMADWYGCGGSGREGQTDRWTD